MSGALAIDVRGLTKAFDGRTVVDHIDLGVPRGEVCGFLGPNGSGKTTTIRMLCGLLEVDAGEGTCLGYDIRREARRIKLRVGYMTQRFGLYEDLSIEENLDFIARVYRIHDRRTRVRAALDRLGLVDRRAQLAGALSGGWKQRLALAACLLHEPELLLLDEPTAGVDPRARRDFWREIHALAAEGITVLVSTHYMDEAERCHRLVYISYGKVLAAGTAAEVVARAGLHTWRVSGEAIGDVLDIVERDGDWMAVPFGTSLHVSSSRNGDFPAWLARHDASLASRVQIAPIATGLEDVFIALTQNARDTLR
ncbi:MAG TPA: ABC transporter ATP-binding protein [Burkholderiaceae bacterium]|nr:ABC transporter ATP-binding protein [Burkholderiaceae bacterium]HQR71346.1 ABC transporter ATP-binding protein [Burkholderiaceae bacterium]